MADKTIKTRGWTLWSRSGYRGPSDLKPGGGTGGDPEPDDPDDPDEPPDQDDPGPAGARAPAPAARRRPARPRPAGTGTLIDQIIADRAIRIEYQAVHDTEHGQVVGFEALTRGPEGPLRSPVQLFAAAQAAGRLGELDWICRVTAFREMLDAGLPPSISLFVNVEADSLIEPCPPDLLPTVQEAEQRLRVYVDLTGRAISRFPCQALETARRARAANWGVAINDIEFSAAGAALLPTLEPDVVKLNHQLISSGLGQANIALIAAMAECERTRAALLVERVENSDAAMIARAAGSHFQQGHLLGKPGPLPEHLPQPLQPIPLLVHPDPDETVSTPWGVLSAGGARLTSAVSQAGLDHLILGITTRAAVGDQPPAVAVVIPATAEMAPERQVMFTMLLERCPLIIIVGPNVSAWSDWRVRAADMPVGHAYTHETCFVVLSPGLSMAVAGQPHGGHPQDPPMWDIAVSQNPDLCRTVMRQILCTVDTLAGGVHHHG
ncbi:EAL domain-containing protein [Dactylosporangium sp. NPDC049525]|uniref:EAL domain-containing protein n=1 Tax=Dactylosporangium sp. NPDC049525 TaxID=3154730 RepID=UPI003448CE65